METEVNLRPVAFSTVATSGPVLTTTSCLRPPISRCSRDGEAPPTGAVCRMMAASLKTTLDRLMESPK
jgi:hypothetical protein